MTIESSFARNSRQAKESNELNTMMDKLESDNKIITQEKDFYKVKYEMSQRDNLQLMEELSKYKTAFLKEVDEYKILSQDYADLCKTIHNNNLKNENTIDVKYEETLSR